VGNLRAYVFVDTLKRTLLYNGYTVEHTMNYTDFGHLTSDADSGEDKMMKGLKREGLDVSLESMEFLADKYIAAFEQNQTALHILPPTHAPRASHYIKEQIRLIETLFEKGYAYTTSDGVYFDVQKYPAYGQLGNIDLDAQKAGARVEINTEKNHPADFALWKNGDLGWESKWGKGFPGWHIECSAMAFATLGQQIDIHTGGIDNATIHHNAEIAQCECATGQTFAQYWLHNEHLNLRGKKLAKSSGNAYTLAELHDLGYSAADYRYLLLQSHYRTPMDFSLEALDASKQALTRIKELMFKDWRGDRGALDSTWQSKIITAINDDLSTPQVIAFMQEIIKSDSLTNGNKKVLLLEIDALLGIGLVDNPDEGLEALGHIAFTSLPENIQTMIKNRDVARIAQNWPEADRLREAISHAGYELKDSSNGPGIIKR